MTTHTNDPKANDLYRNLPSGHNTVNGFIAVRGAAEFFDFLRTVFDGEENKAVRTPDRDGTLIHAEVRIGTATVMLADAKPDWPNFHALTQVYVKDATQVLKRAVARGSRVVTEPTEFYGGVNIARFLDPWENLWWLYEPRASDERSGPKAEVGWHTKEPSYVYRSLMDAMREIAAKEKTGG